MKPFALASMLHSFVSEIPNQLGRVHQLPPVSLHVLYLHTPPVSIFQEYEKSVEWGFPAQCALQERLQQLPEIFQAMEARLERAHQAVLHSPMITAAEHIFSRYATSLEPDPDWHSKDMRAKVYRIHGSRVECEFRDHRVLGRAYVIQHPMTKEECMFWFAPPGRKQLLSFSEWVHYLTGLDIQAGEPSHFFQNLKHALEVMGD